MPNSPEAENLHDNMMWVILDDGRAIGVQVASFPRRLYARPEVCMALEIYPFGFHRKALHENNSVAELISGRGLRTITA